MFADTRKRKLSNGDEYLEEGEFKGFSFQYDEKDKHVASENGHNRAIVGMSNRYARDEDRGGTLPCLDRFPDLRTLEVYKNRYVLTLPDSLAQLPSLHSLRIVRCSRIAELPSAIGGLAKLQEVRRMRLFSGALLTLSCDSRWFSHPLARYPVAARFDGHLRIGRIARLHWRARQVRCHLLTAVAPQVPPPSLSLSYNHTNNIPA